MALQDDEGMTDAQLKEHEDANEFALIFGEFVNNMNDKPKRLAVAQLMREHRTIQQNMMRFVMFFVEAMSQQSFDLRNEASIELAKAIMQIDVRTRTLPRI